MTDDQRQCSVVERVVQRYVLGPLGAVGSWGTDVPRALRDGREALENRVQVARWIGQLAVQQGRRELERLLREAAGGDEQAGEPAPDPTLRPVLEVVPADDEAAAVGPEPTVDDLPIAGYESLAAQNVVQRLGGLRPDEIEVVRRFEASHRARRTVLAKIAQLQEG